MWAAPISAWRAWWRSVGASWRATSGLVVDNVRVRRLERARRDELLVDAFRRVWSER